MRGRRKAPKIRMTDEELLVMEKLAKLVGVYETWWIRVQRIDNREPYDMIRTHDATGRRYDISLQTAVKRLDKECTYEEFSQLNEKEQLVWNNLVFNRLEVVFN